MRRKPALHNHVEYALAVYFNPLRFCCFAARLTEVERQHISGIGALSAKVSAELFIGFFLISLEM